MLITDLDSPATPRAHGGLTSHGSQGLQNFRGGGVLTQPSWIEQLGLDFAFLRHLQILKLYLTELCKSQDLVWICHTASRSQCWRPGPHGPVWAVPYSCPSLYSLSSRHLTLLSIPQSAQACSGPRAFALAVYSAWKVLNSNFLISAFYVSAWIAHPHRCLLKPLSYFYSAYPFHYTHCLHFYFF